MNPELPQVRQNIEAPPQMPGGVEYGLEQATQNPEVQRSAEAGPAPSVVQQQSPVIPTALPVVTVSQPVQDDSTKTVASDDDTPLTAADEDLIEKEWVEKLKKIIVLTKDDPYERSRVIAQLQADYLKKRYNKVLGQDQNNG